MTTPETAAVLAEVATERAAQDAKWGEQNHADRMPADYPVGDTPNAKLAAVHWKNTNSARVAWMNEQGAPRDRNAAWDGILLEEVYEALAEEDPAKLRAELVQVAAVAVAWIAAIDRRTAPAPSSTEDTPATPEPRVWPAVDDRVAWTLTHGEIGAGSPGTVSAVDGRTAVVKWDRTGEEVRVYTRHLRPLSEVASPGTTGTPA